MRDDYQKAWMENTRNYSKFFLTSVGKDWIGKKSVNDVMFQTKVKHWCGGKIT